MITDERASLKYENEVQKEETKVESIRKDIPNPIVVFDRRGNLKFTNHNELAVVCQYYIKIKSVPDHIVKHGPDAVKAAVILTRQLELSDHCMNEMAFFKGRLTVYATLFLAICERAHDYGEKDEYFVDENCEKICVQNKNLKAKPWAAVCTIKKKGGTIWNEYFFSLDDALAAGLLTDSTNKDSAWWKYTKDMLMHKARRRGLNSNYAAATKGLYYHEDVVDWNFKDVSPKSTSGLNEELG